MSVCPVTGQDSVQVGDTVKVRATGAVGIVRNTTQRNSAWGSTLEARVSLRNGVYVTLEASHLDVIGMWDGGVRG